jgi:hypothetical protein
MILLIEVDLPGDDIADLLEMAKAARQTPDLWAQDAILSYLEMERAAASHATTSPVSFMPAIVPIFDHVPTAPLQVTPPSPPANGVDSSTLTRLPPSQSLPGL